MQRQTIGNSDEKIRAAHLKQFLRQGKGFLRRFNARQLMVAQGARGSRDTVGKGRGHNQRVRQFLAQALKPRRPIHGRAQDREIEPIGGTDIAVDDRSLMQGDTDGNRRPAEMPALDVGGFDTCEGIDRGIQSLGFVMAVGILMTLLACWIVMPAWLELRARRSKQ